MLYTLFEAAVGCGFAIGIILVVVACFCIWLMWKV